MRTDAPRRPWTLALVAAVSGLSLSLFPGSPAPAATTGTHTGATVPSPSVPTLAGPTSAVWEDRPVVLSGTVSIPPVEVDVVTQQAPVQLWWQPSPGRWARIGAPLTPDARGRFTFTHTWTQPRAVTIQARQGSLPASASVRFRVRDRRVVLARGPRRARVLADRIVASGHIVPREAGVAVRLRVKVPGQRARTIGVRTDTTGRWSRALASTHRTGRLTIRAVTGDRTALERSRLRRTQLVPGFVVSSTPVTRATVRWTYRPGCPVGPAQLRALRMTYRAYDGSYQWGRMIVARTAIPHVTAAFRRGFDTGFRIRQMHPVERYRGSDPAAMADNNTSAFNCRQVTGDPFSLSPHAYGTAVDINTVQNPYQDSSGRWWPSTSAWADRGRSHPGMIKASSPIRVEFSRRGFDWGGFWGHPDWQHFDPRGRLRPRTGALTTGVLPRELPGGFRPSAAGGHTHDAHHSTEGIRERDLSQVRDALAVLCGPLPAGVQLRGARQGTYRSVDSPDATAQALTLQTSTRAGAAGLVEHAASCRTPEHTISAARTGTRRVLLTALPAR